MVEDLHLRLYEVIKCLFLLKNCVSQNTRLCIELNYIFIYSYSRKPSIQKMNQLLAVLKYMAIMVSFKIPCSSSVSRAEGSALEPCPRAHAYSKVKRVQCYVFFWNFDSKKAFLGQNERGFIGGECLH